MIDNSGLMQNVEEDDAVEETSASKQDAGEEEVAVETASLEEQDVAASPDKDAVKMFPQVSSPVKESTEQPKESGNAEEATSTVKAASMTKETASSQATSVTDVDVEMQNAAPTSTPAPTVSTPQADVEMTPAQSTSTLKSTSTSQPVFSFGSRPNAATASASYAAAAKPPFKFVPVPTVVPPSTQATLTSLNAASATPRTPATTVMSQTPSTMSGRLLNLRPKRNVRLDGQANFVQISVPPARGGKTLPPVTTYNGILKAFSALKSVDKDVVFYPIYDTEEGEEEVPAICDVSQFAKTLPELQSNWLGISNGWELGTIYPGQIDRQTGEQKKYKTIYCSVLLGTRYSLEYVLERSVPALSADGIMVRKKDVDALHSKPICALLGLPNGWCAEATARRFHKALAQHEEWMQANVRHSYDAKEFSGEAFPPIVHTKKPIKMPKNKDILNAEEVQALDYLAYLRTAQHVEVSACDEYRVTGVIRDLEARGKLNILSQFCTLYWLNKNDKEKDDNDRIQELRDIKAQVNFNHKYREATFAGIENLFYPTKPQSTDGSQVFKKSNPKREILDIRRPSDGSKLICGVMECSGDKEGSVSVCFYDDDESERIVNGMKGNLAAFLYQYCKHIKKYSPDALKSLSSSFGATYRLSVADCSFDVKTYELKTLKQATTSSSLSTHMTSLQIDGILPELLKQAENNKKKKMFSDAAMERVAQTQNLKDKPGFNTHAPDEASAFSDATKSSSGNASNRSVVTADIQIRLPELRMTLHELKSRLQDLNSDDLLFKLPIMSDSAFEELSLNSSASEVLASFFKDTQQCITLLKARLAELEHGDPPPKSGSAEPAASTEDGCVSAQGS